MSGSRINIPAFMVIMLLGAGLCSCGGNGKVYLSFTWWDTWRLPDSGFTCSSTEVPISFNLVEKGKYYLTGPGAFNLVCTYSAGLPASFNYNFTLEASSSILGSENTYYDIVLYPDYGPLLYRVPYTYDPTP